MQFGCTPYNTYLPPDEQPARAACLVWAVLLSSDARHDRGLWYTSFWRKHYFSEGRGSLTPNRPNFVILFLQS